MFLDIARPSITPVVPAIIISVAIVLVVGVLVTLIIKMKHAK